MVVYLVTGKTVLALSRLPIICNPCPWFPVSTTLCVVYSLYTVQCRKSHQPLPTAVSILVRIFYRPAPDGQRPTTKCWKDDHTCWKPAQTCTGTLLLTTVTSVSQSDHVNGSWLTWGAALWSCVSGLYLMTARGQRGADRRSAIPLPRLRYSNLGKCVVGISVSNQGWNSFHFRGLKLSLQLPSQ